MILNGNKEEEGEWIYIRGARISVIKRRGIMVINKEKSKKFNQKRKEENENLEVRKERMVLQRVEGEEEDLKNNGVKTIEERENNEKKLCKEEKGV